MELLPVNSSTLSKVGYDPSSGTMIIVFNTGSTYEFQQMPKDIYDNLLNSPSLGAFFNQNIRKRFMFKKIV